MASRLNALKTLPAPLAPATGFWAKGKSLVKFYKTGVANVWHNRATANEIRRKYDSTTGFSLARAIVENSHLAVIEHNVLKTAAATRVAVKRDELLTLLRTERDFKKLPLFVVVFAVFFELTPIVLWGFPRIAPSTCWSATFNSKLRERYSSIHEEVRKMGSSLDGSESVFRLEAPAIRLLSSLLDFGHHYRILPTKFLRQRLLRHITEIRADDIILRQNIDKLEELESEELKRALMSRALPLNGGVGLLREWLTQFKEPMDAGFFFKGPTRKHN